VAIDEGVGMRDMAGSLGGRDEVSRREESMDSSNAFHQTP
jgi:hypothetical protein